jgi:hypothetical protein
MSVIVGLKIKRQGRVGYGYKKDRSSWLVGGITVIGVGIGFILLETSVLLFVASILTGIGAGLARALHFKELV